MRWLCIDATARDHLVVCLEHGVDLHVGPTLAELVERSTGRLIVAWIIPSA
jgi:hypothetical protein